MPSKNPVLTGYFSRAGHPAIKIGVYGIHAGLKQEFEAIIDTGFTGFLLMPIMSAFSLGLTLAGTGSYTLADNTTSAKLLAIGAVTVENEEPLHGIIVLESNQCSTLLGMDFLRRTKRCLTVSVKGVALVDEDLVKQFLAAIEKERPAAPEAPHSEDGSD